MNQVFDDWKSLVDDLQLTTRGNDQAYLYHNGKPLVALWGLGSNSRHGPDGLDMDFWFKLTDKSFNDPNRGVLDHVGVPTRWREGGSDALSGTEHERMIELIKQADIVMPWHTSRFRRPDLTTTFANLVAADITWTNLRYDVRTDNQSGIARKSLIGTTTKFRGRGDSTSGILRGRL